MGGLSENFTVIRSDSHEEFCNRILRKPLPSKRAIWTALSLQCEAWLLFMRWLETCEDAVHSH